MSASTSSAVASRACSASLAEALILSRPSKGHPWLWNRRDEFVKLLLRLAVAGFVRFLSGCRGSVCLWLQVGRERLCRLLNQSGGSDKQAHIACAVAEEGALLVADQTVGL